jgi:beta-N-acetylhexosaminidase
LANEFLTVLQASGITGCIKHFPGLGASRVDSHEELPMVDIDEAEWRSIDLYPYRVLLETGEVRAIMAAHAAFPNLNLQEAGQNGKLLPSSLSYNVVTSLLRGELRYDGLVITDDLEMGAIKNNYGIGEACTIAIAAGADMLAICADPDAIREGYRAVLDAVEDGRISAGRIDESLARIAKVKSLLPTPAAFDRDRLQALSDRVARLCEHS